MPKHISIHSKATEAATFRFTQHEKRLLEHLAELEQCTQTDMVRTLIASRVAQLGAAFVLPEKEIRRKPGRPRKLHPSPPVVSHSSVSFSAPEPLLEATEPTSSFATNARVSSSAPESLSLQMPSHKAVVPRTKSLPARIHTFDDLIGAFRAHFSGRAEGTRSEFEETIVFLDEIFSLEDGLTRKTKISEIDTAILFQVRDVIKAADIRFPRKNLYLTYIRMMLQFAMKQKDVALTITPAADLPAFTAKEISDAWPLSVKNV